MLGLSRTPSMFLSLSLSYLFLHVDSGCNESEDMSNYLYLIYLIISSIYHMSGGVLADLKIIGLNIRTKLCVWLKRSGAKVCVDKIQTAINHL